jgi:iron complex transport system permease protein
VGPLHVSADAVDLPRAHERVDPRGRGWLAASLLAFVIAALVLPFVGPAPLDFDRIWAHEEPDWSILVQLRLSRTLLGLFAGGALALAGCLFQALLRDALATPYTLGVSAGASLGAVLVIATGAHTLLGVPAIWLGALLGAASVLAVVLTAAARGGRVSAFSLLLTGIALNSVCTAAIMVVHGVSSVAQSFSISRWLLGSIDSTSYGALLPFVVIVLVVALLVARQARHWNLLAVGEAWAASRGANVSRLLLAGYVAGSILAASTVALTGPIGFVGLVVPHLARGRVGADHRTLLPCSFLLGGVFLAACDALGRWLLAPAELPAGAILALVGGPYLVWMIRRRS